MCSLSSEVGFPGDMRICLDGNIGSCKTSVLTILSDKYFLPIHPEPIDHWENYLVDMYNKKPGVGFEFQVLVWLDRVLNIKSGCITERSGYFQLNTFIKSSYDIGERKESLFQKLYTDAHVPKPHLIIYLKSDPKKCMDRIRARGRVYETQITESYITYLHELYENAFETATECPVVLIEIENKTSEVIAKECYTLINKFFINRT